MKVLNTYVRITEEDRKLSPDAKGKRKVKVVDGEFIRYYTKPKLTSTVILNNMRKS